MGKASRRKETSSGVLTLPRPERVELILRSAGLATQLNARKPRCIQTAALLVRASELLGIRAEPIPVAVVVQGQRGTVQMGAALDGTVPLLGGGELVRSGVGQQWDGAGHVIVYLTADEVLIDATIDQTSDRTGLPHGTLTMPQVARRDLDEPAADVGHDGWHARYLAVPSDRSWQDSYNTQYALKGRDARLIVRRSLELRGHDEDLQPIL